MTTLILTFRDRDRLLIRTLFWLLMVTGLAACSTLPGGPTLGGGPSLAKARQAAERGDHQEAASIYIQLASGEQADARDRYTLLAAGQWVEAGDARRASTAISGIEEPLDQPLRNDWLLTSGAVLILRGDGDAALRKLDDAVATDFSLNQRIIAERVRGDAYFLAGQPTIAISTLQKRELWLNSGTEIEDNHQRIWDGLLQSDPDELRTAFDETNDSTTRGWLALGSLADGSLKGGPVAGIASWQRQFPDHPAMRFIVPGIVGQTFDQPNGKPQHIALLVTQSGRTGVVGKAVAEGFLSHYAEMYAGRIDAPQVRVYDIAEDGATLTYQRAVENGADFIVGPILRSPVDELAANFGLRTRTLLLNYVQEPPPAGSFVYEFGLAPEDEARAAAQRAFAEGHRRAIALVPTSNWGERVLQAFEAEFTALGGQLLDHQRYLPTEPDYKNEIQALMLLTDSVARYRQMRSTLGGTLQFEPRRRADADFIFMGANSDSAKRLKPQLRFHYAGDLPVYSTSSVYRTQNSNGNRDLNGIRFSDAKWLIDGLAGEQTPLRALSPYFPSARAQPRLFALGYDAFSVVELVTSSGQGDATIDGATGDLTLINQRVRRSPAWAVFESGNPVALPAMELPRANVFDVPREQVIERIENDADGAL